MAGKHSSGEPKQILGSLKSTTSEEEDSQVSSDMEEGHAAEGIPYDTTVETIVECETTINTHNEVEDGVPCLPQSPPPTPAVLKGHVDSKGTAIHINELGNTQSFRSWSSVTHYPRAVNIALMYSEIKREYLIQGSKTVERLQHEKSELNAKLTQILANYAALQKEFDTLKEKKGATGDNGKKDAPCSTLEFILSQHQTMIKEKDESIGSLKEKIKSMENEKVCCLRIGSSDTEMFKIKPKTSRKKKKDEPVMELKCEFTDCGKDNIDLVKCNICEKWVCEDCNDIVVAKLKQVVSKCNNVFFVCQECEPNSTRAKQNVSSDMVTTLKTLFDSKVCEVETKLVDIIEKKLGENTVAPEMKERAKQQEDTYAKVLAVPAEIKKIMKEVKNDEKVEGKEMEKQARNFIIHGAEEIGNGDEEIKKNDEQYIKKILKKIGVQAEPEDVTRLGKPNEKRRRTIKVEMKSIVDKDKVRSNLNKLKGSEEEFGKISITSDYTKSERDEIKAMSEKARAQTDASEDRIFKVRGDPKNGLKIVSFVRKEAPGKGAQ